MSLLDAGRLAAIELEERRRRVRAEQGPRFDWYGDECGCGLALGECREHPRARPSQRPPGSRRSAQDRDDWRFWVLMAGRGFGKTRSAAEFVTREVQAGRAGWVALINETVKDVRDVQIEHPDSGLLAVAPPWFRPIYEPSKARVTWPNGAFATIYSAEQPNALRGPQFSIGWCDEFAKWKFGQREVLDNLNMCLRARTDPRPRVVMTTTPQPTAEFREILEDPRTVITTGSTFENTAHLDPDFIRYIEQKYGGTRLGRQELFAHMLDDVPGALWQRAWIDAHRLPAVPYSVGLRRVVVAVDPNAGSQDPEKAAETGIAVCARGSDRRGYLLADCSTKGTPEAWAKAALRAYALWDADAIVAEKNNGGAMVESTLRAVEAGPDHPGGKDVPIKLVWASRGKEIRAQPVAALYEAGRISHVGRFDALEDQLCRFDPENPKACGLVDRLDALVWALTEVMLGGGNPGTVMVGGRRG